MEVQNQADHAVDTTVDTTYLPVTEAALKNYEEYHTEETLKDKSIFEEVMSSSAKFDGWAQAGPHHCEPDSNWCKENIDIRNMCGLELLESLPDKSVDLILTDPPYITSRDTGMNAFYNTCKENEANGIEQVKTEEEWFKYKEEKNIENDDKKHLYLKYGTIYGNTYSVKTDYGDWDKDFSLEILDKFIEKFYKKLRKGGSLIIFFDLWKITPLKDLLEKHKFSGLRMIEWVKNNPQPLNSGRNYLTNAREIALTAVKGGKPTFNSKYDKGLYHYPLQPNKHRFHPTQKNLKMIEELVEKHSHPNDLVVDTFLGSGTTAIACKHKYRRFIGSEISKEYYDKTVDLLPRM